GRPVEEVLGGPEGLHGEPDGPEQAREGIPDGGIIIYHKHNSVCLTHTLPSAPVGRVKRKVAPCSSFGMAHSWPPCASTMARLIRNPMPMPPGLVEKNGSNIFSTSSARSPMPVSCTLTSTPPSACRCVWTCRARGRSTTARIASILLRTRFSRTCWTWTRSPSTGGTSSPKTVCMAMCCRRASAPTGRRASSIVSWRGRGGSAGRRRWTGPRRRVTTPRAHDPLHGGAGLVEVRTVPLQPPQASRAVGDDRGERLRDFMGDRGRQLAQRHHPRDVGQLHLGLVQRLFGALALGQVEHERDALVLPALEQRGANQDRHATAAFLDVLFLIRLGGSGRLQLCHTAVVGIAVFGGCQVPPAHATRD